ncbi:MAG: hypothetical protein JST01_19210 [Cyanobacteria bacterium SZAS TMP-1]|nr:hypothetical protein [Cyanobacteria bacterium SZAS TMP-1]
MPIVYIHGVNVRSDEYWPALEAMMRQYIAPVISPNPERVSISQCYWGDVGAYFRFQGASMPTSPIVQMGRVVKGKVRQDIGRVRSRLKTRREKIAAYRPGQLTARLRADGLSDLSARVLSSISHLSGHEQTLALQAADQVATELASSHDLQECRSLEDEMSLFQKLVRSRYAKLRAMHGLPELKSKPEWMNGLSARLMEGLERYSDVPGFILTRAAAEVRSPVNTMVTAFIGDVFTYIRERGDYKNPGPIPARALETLLRASEIQESQLAESTAANPQKEPLVVLSHSMGGQITYDLVTHFLPRDAKYKDVYIDFWCASASQVGFFEELKLFLESDEKYSSKSGVRVPRPDEKHLGYWWNVWDHNDFISYSVKNIFDGVEDAVYNTGMFLADAHGGYLVRPSFFRQFAEKLQSELKLNQNTQA